MLALCIPWTHTTPWRSSKPLSKRLAPATILPLSTSCAKPLRCRKPTLGPHHPDLANTLNNLAIVCEMANKPADAERCYRRAYSIAVTALEPHHPFVATSRQNLVDFWHARGMHGELPKTAPTTTASDEHASARAPLDDRSWPSASRPSEPQLHGIVALYRAWRRRRGCRPVRAIPDPSAAGQHAGTDRIRDGASYRVAIGERGAHCRTPGRRRTNPGSR